MQDLKIDLESDAKRFRFILENLAMVKYKEIRGQGFIPCEVYGPVINGIKQFTLRKNLRQAVDVLMSSERTNKGTQNLKMTERDLFSIKAKICQQKADCLKQELKENQNQLIESEIEVHSAKARMYRLKANQSYLL